MSDWAAPDYEPTPDEVRDTFGYFADAVPGDHGSMVLLPTMERYIWNVEGIFWSGREMREDGMVEIAWLKPARNHYRHRDES